MEKVSKYIKEWLPKRNHPTNTNNEENKNNNKNKILSGKAKESLVVSVLIISLLSSNSMKEIPKNRSR